MTDLTAELIADMAVPEDLALSPDGRWVVYALRPSGKKEEHATCALWLAPADGSAPPRQFTAGDSDDRAPAWSPDGAQIAFLSDRSKRGTAQLYVIAADGGEGRALTNVENKRPVLGFSWSPGGGHIAFASADEPTDEDERREKERDDADVWGERWRYARLRLVSLASQEVTTLVGRDRHVDAWTWSPAGTEIAYSLRQTPALETLDRETVVERVPIAGGEPSVIFRFPCSVRNLTWSRDGATLLFVAPVAKRPQSSAAVYSVPAHGGEPRRIAFGEGSCGVWVGRPRESARAVAAEAKGLESRLCWLNAATGAAEPFYPPPEDAACWDLASWSVQVPAEGGLALAVVRSAAGHPPEIWGGRSSEATMPPLRQVTHHQASLGAFAWGTEEAFTWTAPDGWQLDGILVRPPGAPRERPLPTVMLVHGGPYGRWRPGFHLGWADWAQWLATAGYAALMPNPRGGMGHGEAFAAAARGDVGGADYRDVMAAVDAAVERGIADPERLAIGGWSQGGFMTAWAVTQTSRFKVGVMGAGVSDWGMMAMTSDLPDFERALGGSAPWDGVGPLRAAELSPISYARHVATPLLILHGRNDERVPVSQAIGFHRALREAGAPTELVIYPREPHGIGERAHQIDVLRRVRSWLDRWLRA